jgi:hypothetical protein
LLVCSCGQSQALPIGRDDNDHQLSATDLAANSH